MNMQPNETPPTSGSTTASTNHQTGNPDAIRANRTGPDPHKNPAIRKDHAHQPETTEVGWAMPLLTVIVTAFAIFTAFLGSGAIGGTPIAEAAGGALSADATPLAPASTAFSIWSVIYAGLAGYAIWQLFPVARRSTRQKCVSSVKYLPKERRNSGHVSIPTGHVRSPKI